MEDAVIIDEARLTGLMCFIPCIVIRITGHLTGNHIVNMRFRCVFFLFRDAERTDYNTVVEGDGKRMRSGLQTFEIVRVQVQNQTAGYMIHTFFCVEDRKTASFHEREAYTLKAFLYRL